MTISPLFCYRVSAIAEFSFCGNCICIIVFLCSFKPAPSVLAPFFPRPFDSLLCACLPLFRSPIFQRPHPYLPCLSLSSFLGLLASLSLFASLLFFLVLASIFSRELLLRRLQLLRLIAPLVHFVHSILLFFLTSLLKGIYVNKRMCSRSEWLGDWARAFNGTDLFCAVHPIFSFGFHQNTETKKTEGA